MSFIDKIRELSREYKYAIMFFHQDADGLTSAIAMRELLKDCGIKVIDCTKMQYGNINIQTDFIIKEYNEIYSDKKVMYVLVDFSQGHESFKIHTDHHLETSFISEDVVGHNMKAASNAGTISHVLSERKIFSDEDIKMINMVDSAAWKGNNVSLDDMLQLEYDYNPELSKERNNVNLAICVYKLIDVLKNKKTTTEKFAVASIKDKRNDFILNRVVMNSKPSMIDIYNNLVKEMNKIGLDIKDIESRFNLFQEYCIDMSDKHSDISIESPKDLFNALRQPIKAGTKSESKGKIEYSNIVCKNGIVMTRNCVVPMEYMYPDNNYQYNRYLHFSAIPDADYTIKLFEDGTMLQCSHNPFKKVTNGKNIAEICDSLIDKYSDEMKEFKLDLYTFNEYLNKVYEKGIYSEYKKMKDWGKSRPTKFYITSDIITKFKPFMTFDGKILDDSVNKGLVRVAEISLNDIELGKVEKENLISYLKRFEFNFYDYCKLYSGGHTAIYNLQFAPVDMELLQNLMYEDSKYNTYFKKFIVLMYKINFDLYKELKG